MRLWHYKLIPYLPELQLLAQWRELNSIFANKPRHILINYVYNYSKDYLYTYTNLVINEMQKRNIKVKSMEHYNTYFENIKYNNEYFVEHDDIYLTICYYNLTEKYLRGQKDFSQILWERLNYFYILNINKK